MNIAEFLNIASDEHIRPDAYDLSGCEESGEQYVVKKDGPLWAVFYAERGLQSGRTSFSTESDALYYLLKKLLADPTTRVK